MPKTRQKQPIRVIVLASLKGGSSKTSLSAALAAKLSATGARVSLVDTDPQASLARWHELRGSPENPKVEDVDTSMEALAHAANYCDFLIVDTPPALMDRIEAAIHSSDFVVIPVRPSPLDLEAANDVAVICKDMDKPYAFLLAQVPDKGFARLAQNARKYLAKRGPVFGTQITFRKAYITAMTLGKSAPEHGDATAKKEIDDLWDELQKLAREYHG